MRGGVGRVGVVMPYLEGRETEENRPEEDDQNRSAAASCGSHTTPSRLGFHSETSPVRLASSRRITTLPISEACRCCTPHSCSPTDKRAANNRASNSQCNATERAGKRGAPRVRRQIASPAPAANDPSGVRGWWSAGGRAEERGTGWCAHHGGTESFHYVRQSLDRRWARTQGKRATLHGNAGTTALRRIVVAGVRVDMHAPERGDAEERHDQPRGHPSLSARDTVHEQTGT